jgi:Abortive infection C-terminus
LENYLKAILDGLQKQVGGLFQLANKASDRHARCYNPAKHHAKLAVNAAFTLCEFLLESYEYQQALAAKKKTS